MMAPKRFPVQTLVLLLCLVDNLRATSVPRTMPVRDGRIIGGVDADIKDYPYQALVAFGGGLMCGGSIISSSFVLTAAHCLEREITYYSVRVGSSFANDGDEYRVIKMISHELWGTSGTYDYDIGLIQIHGGFTFGPNVQAISLPEQGEAVVSGSIAVVTGWGMADNGYPNALQKVEVPIVSNAECSSSFRYDFVHTVVTQRMICAGYKEGGKDACGGDSGGPLVVNGKEVGIVSWGLGCALPNYPGVYARVATLRNWIFENSGV